MLLLRLQHKWPTFSSRALPVFCLYISDLYVQNIGDAKGQTLASYTYNNQQPLTATKSTKKYE